MKRVWKPVGIMGLRLYKVVTTWPRTLEKGDVKESVVAANSPREAADIVAAQYKDVTEDRRPYCRGLALNVCQPAEWWEGMNPVVSPLDCKHDHMTNLCSSSGTGGPDNWRENASLCLDCGEIHVSATRNGQFFKIQFGLNCDDHLRAAARYMRSEPEIKDAIERAKQ